MGYVSADKYSLICLLKDAAIICEDLLVEPPHLYDVEAVVPWCDKNVDIYSDQDMIQLFEELGKRDLKNAEFVIHPRSVAVELATPSEQSPTESGSDTPEKECSVEDLSQCPETQPQTNEPRPVQEEDSSSSEFDDSSDEDFSMKEVSDESSDEFDDVSEEPDVGDDGQDGKEGDVGSGNEGDQAVGNEGYHDVGHESEDEAVGINAIDLSLSFFWGPQTIACLLF